MVIPIDAIRYGAGFDAAGQWHEPQAGFVDAEEQRQAAEILAPARGVACGLLLSAALWVGLAAAAHALLTMLR
ncbi:MAG TPA: hypothetical protein VGF88_22335 [Acidobacteriaceae bacterium]|jgi:hypothetical protein